MADPDPDLRDEIQRIALEFPSYGWPRITAELKTARLGSQPQARVPDHARGQSALPAPPEARGDYRFQSQSAGLSEPGTRNDVDRPGSTLGGMNITYIRLETEFVYLAVVLDAYSRRVTGWALDRTLEEELTLAALRMALDRRLPAPGLVHLFRPRHPVRRSTITPIC